MTYVEYPLSSSQVEYLHNRVSALASINLDMSFAKSYNVPTRIRTDAKDIRTVCTQILDYVHGMRDRSSVGIGNVSEVQLITLEHHVLATMGISEDIVEHLSSNDHDGLATDIALLLWEADNITYQVELLGGGC